MRQAYSEQYDVTEPDTLDDLNHEWHVVDCFNLDAFIEDKRQRPEDIWASDDDYPVEDWQYEVSEDNTRLGYWEWVQHQRSMNDEA